MADPETRFRPLGTNAFNLDNPLFEHVTLFTRGPDGHWHETGRNPKVGPSGRLQPARRHSFRIAAAAANPGSAF